MQSFRLIKPDRVSFTEKHYYYLAFGWPVLKFEVYSSFYV